jgi:hypothetical protein
MTAPGAVPAALLGPRYAGRGGHVESWFLKANDPSGKRALWVRVTVFAREGARHGAVPPVAEAWAIAFDRERGHVATKSTVTLENARFARGTLDVEVDGCALSLGRARGRLETGGRTLAWDLAVGPERSAPVIHLPQALYEARFPASKLVTPLADGRVEGKITLRRAGAEPEESWDVAGWPAMIGHNWGRGHAHLYAWTHCNVWEENDDLVIEAVSARVRMGALPLLSPMATAVFVRLGRERFDLGALEGLGKNRGTVSLRRWELAAEGHGLRITGELAAETDDFVGLHYPNPSGAPTYCLNTKLARGRFEIALPGGRTLVATTRSAAFEIGTRDRHHGVRMVL